VKNLFKSTGLLCSATVLTIWSHGVQAASPNQQLESLNNNSPTSSIANSPPSAIANPANLTSPASLTNLEPAAPLAVGSALPELNPQGIQITTPKVELPELETISNQAPVAVDLTPLVSSNSPINFLALSTSAADLAPPQPADNTLAQRVGDRVSPFAPTAYIGVGLNLGLGSGDSDLSRGRFVIYGKLGLTQNISVRPAVLLGNDTTFLIPITYDFPLQAADAIQPVSFVPYLGGGAIFSTRSGNNNLGFLLSGGIDIPISRDFTATAGLNVGFIRSTTDFGILLGIAYNIPGFRF